MMTNAVRSALVALFVTTTGCAATADDASDDVAVSVETNVETQREHILLARQVGVPSAAPSAAYSCDDRSCSCSGYANCNALITSGACGDNRLTCSADGVCYCAR